MLQPPTVGDKHRFVADQMVGRLAKWLRLLGFDTLYFKSIADSKLITIAKQEARILLTRDTRLAERREARNQQVTAILIKSSALDEQLKQVIKELSLDKGTFLSTPLCAECNVEIEEVPKSEVKPFVPSHVFETHKSFGKCPKCNRCYWEGSHWKGILKKVASF